MINKNLILNKIKNLFKLNISYNIGHNIALDYIKKSIISKDVSDITKCNRGDIIYDSNLNDLFIFDEVDNNRIKVFCDWWLTHDDLIVYKRSMTYMFVDETYNLKFATKEQTNKFMAKLFKCGYKWCPKEQKLVKL